MFTFINICFNSCSITFIESALGRTNISCQHHITICSCLQLDKRSSINSFVWNTIASQIGARVTIAVYHFQHRAVFAVNYYSSLTNILIVITITYCQALGKSMTLCSSICIIHDDTRLTKCKCIPTNDRSHRRTCNSQIVRCRVTLCVIGGNGCCTYTLNEQLVAWPE